MVANNTEGDGEVLSRPRENFDVFFCEHSPFRYITASIISAYKTRSQAVARIADRTASQQTLVISDCC